MKEQLIQLGAEKLAEALINIAQYNEEAALVVERLISTEEENLKRFKTRLTSLKKSDRFISWRESSDFSNKLRDILDDLELANPAPNQGLKLISSFIKTDNEVLNRCDDSDGIIGEIYSSDARNLFITYARACDDKDWIEDLLFEFMHDDGFGVRESILDEGKEYLPKSNLQSLIQKFQRLSEKEENTYRKKSYLRFVEELARQINDPKLFEKTRTGDGESLSSYDCLCIAKVYLENEEPHCALSWANRVTDEPQFFEKMELLLKIHEKLQNHDEVVKIATSLFKRRRSTSTLNQLLSAVGNDKKDALLNEELKEISQEKNFSLSTIDFLIEQRLFEEGAHYIIKHGNSLNGDCYSSLLSIATCLEQTIHLLATSLIYRALLNSILQRAYSKAYPYAAQYLNNLDHLADKISNWQSFENHDQYKENLLINHGRKTSFWPKYKQFSETENE